MEGYQFNSECPMTIKEAQELYESNVLMVTKSTFPDCEMYFFEVAYGNRHLKYVEDANVYIEEGIIEPWEIEEYVLSDSISILYAEESEENDLEFIDDVMEDLLYEIGNPRDGECSHDILKRYLVDMYETGRLDMLNEIIEDIDG